MKYILIILTILFIGCSQKGHLETNPDPLYIQDTVELAPKQTKWYTSQMNPTRGQIKVILDNYSDSAKKFVILVKEVK